MSEKRLKLITEEVDYQSLEFLTEESNSEKTFRIIGPFMQYDIKNNNHRIYPKHLMEREVNRYTKEEISRRNSLGEWCHNTKPIVDRERAAILIEALEDDNVNSYVGKAKVLKNFPYGRLVHNLLLEGIPVAVSSRSLGTVNSYGIVNDDFRLVCIDVINSTRPGAPDAFVQGILESAEYLVQGDKLVEVAVEKLQANLDKNGSKQLTEALQSFLSSIKKI